MRKDGKKKQDDNTPVSEEPVQEPEAPAEDVLTAEEMATSYFIPPYAGEPSYFVKGATDAADAITKITKNNA